MRLFSNARQYDVPIVTDMDVGHMQQVFTVPIAVVARIDSDVRRFAIGEPAVL